MNKNDANGERYDTKAQGLIIVKSENSLFNADFSGSPRQLPDKVGTIYATDKAIKYCIRSYMRDRDEKKVFVFREKKEDGSSMNIDDKYESMFGSKPDEKDTYGKGVLKNLLTMRDVRLFGNLYAGNKVNVSVTGPIQISYGVNKGKHNIKFDNQILSPWKNLKKDEAKQNTLGSETKSSCVHYVYDYFVNPNTLIGEGAALLKDDIDVFKEACRKSVSETNSASKVGSFNELFLYIEMKSEVKNNGFIESTSLNPLANFVRITDSESGMTEINLENLFKMLSDYEQEIERIEIYYEPNGTKVTGLDKVSDKLMENKSERNIITGEAL